MRNRPTFIRSNPTITNRKSVSETMDEDYDPGWMYEFIGRWESSDCVGYGYEIGVVGWGFWLGEE